MTATELSDTDMIFKATEDSREFNGELAELLKSMADNFAYDQILSSLQKSDANLKEKYHGILTC